MEKFVLEFVGENDESIECEFTTKDALMICAQLMLGAASNVCYSAINYIKNLI